MSRKEKGVCVLWARWEREGGRFLARSAGERCTLGTKEKTGGPALERGRGGDVSDGGEAPKKKDTLIRGRLVLPNIKEIQNARGRCQKERGGGGEEGILASSCLRWTVEGRGAGRGFRRSQAPKKKSQEGFEEKRMAG